MGGATPVLWQIKVSHYNEKARWALDYKRVEHRRRAPLPLIGTLPIAWVLTRGTTFPVLRLDGRSIGDSSRIIAALEERFPRPPLYPSDRSDRERALALEEFFDEQVAPHVRRLVWYETTTAPRAFMATAMPDSGRVVRRALGLAAAPVAALVRRRYAVTTRTAAAAREQIVDGMRRLEREIGPGGYLAGDSASPT